MGEEPAPGADVVRRLAVRAIVMRDERVLLLHATRTGCHKFPGGGVKPDEEPGAALARELDEEATSVIDSGAAPEWAEREREVLRLL